MLYLGPHAGLKLLGPVQQSTQRRLFIQCPALTRAHGHASPHPWLLPVWWPLATGIGKHDRFLAMQQSVALGHKTGKRVVVKLF